MENKIAELKKIKEALEVLINESEKPKFEVGKWYKETDTKAIYCLSQFNGLGEKCNTYGFNYCGEWMNHDANRRFKNYENTIEATPAEVEEALIKEAEKRGFKEGVVFIAPTSKDRFTAKGEIEIWQSNDTFGLSFSNSQGLILDNGVWAELIKTKTIDEIARDLSVLSEYGIISYMSSTENKQTIIETLNNL